MKQTAIEWLVEQLEEDDSKIARVIGLKKYNSIIKQAIEMEKQQIIDAVDETNRKWRSENAEVLLSGKQYYNETFNK
jgi:GTP-dependent phosphoenolpyruvate carboxykinase